MPKGMDSYEENEKSRASSAAGVGGMKKLFLNTDAPMARIRFLTELNDMWWVFTHSYKATTRLGGERWSSVYCLQHNDNQECSFCNENRKAWQDDPAAASKFPIKKNMLFLVYVYGTYHLSQNKDNKLEVVEYLDKKYFYESVNAVRLMITGPGKDGTFRNRMIEWSRRHKGLTNRDYDWTRDGEGIKTTYDLVPREDPATKDEEKTIKAVSNELAGDALEKIVDSMKAAAVKQQNEAPTVVVEEAPRPKTPEEIKKELQSIFGE